MSKWQFKNYMFQPGNKNPAVYQIKKFLQFQPNVKCNLKLNDVFDSSTQGAIADFQRYKRLRIQDGSLNFETYGAIGNSLNPIEREIITNNDLHLNILFAGMTADEYDACRLSALKKLAQELGAKEEEFDTTADKVKDVGVGIAIWGAAGAVGGVVTGVLGGAAGGVNAVYNFSEKDRRLERPIVNRFWKAEARCQAIQDEIDKLGPSMGAAPDRSKNFFVVTREHGTFALYPYYKFIGYNEDRVNNKDVLVPKYLMMSASPTDQFGKSVNPYLPR